MISREQVALVYNYAREQAHLREELQELGNQALLRRLDVPERTVAESHMCSWLTRRRCTFPLDNPTAVSSDEQFVHIQSPAALHREPEVLLPALGIASAPVTDNQLEDLPSQNPPDDESVCLNLTYCYTRKYPRSRGNKTMIP